MAHLVQLSSLLPGLGISLQWFATHLNTRESVELVVSAVGIRRAYDTHEFDGSRAVMVDLHSAIGDRRILAFNAIA